MIAAIGVVAEMRIKEALDRGDFNNLPGAGQPLDLDDDASIPEDLRMAYKLLKNGGYLDVAGPDAASAAPASLGDMLRTAPDERATLRRMLKLQVVEARMKDREGRALHLADSDAYHGKVVERLPIQDKK